MLRLRGIWDRLSASMWPLPTLAVAVALLLGLVLPRVRFGEGSTVTRLLFGGDIEGARSILAAVAGSLITVTGVVYSLTLVALQLASTQYSPRLLRNFMEDRGTQVVLAVFVGTFTYSLTVLGVTAGGQERAPRLAVTVALLLAICSILLLVYFIHHVSFSIRADRILQAVTRHTLRAIERVYPADQPHEPPGDLPEPPDDALVVPCKPSGYLQAVDADALLRLAVGHGVVIRLRHTVGTHLVSGAPLAWVWPCGDDGHDPADPEALCEGIDDAVACGFERTLRQDVPSGVLQLVDIGCRALSPGINDPTTAADALANLSVLVSALARRPLRHQLRLDDRNRIRVAVPRPDFASYLHLAFDRIRRYAAAEPAVTSRLLKVLADVAAATEDLERRRAVAGHIDLVMDDAERETAQPADLDNLRELAENARSVIGGEQEPEPTMAE